MATKKDLKKKLKKNKAKYRELQERLEQFEKKWTALGEMLTKMKLSIDSEQATMQQDEKPRNEDEGVA